MCMHYISYWGGRNHITFLGDSRIRQLFFDFVNLLGYEEMKPRKAHEDIHFKDDQISARVVRFCCSISNPKSLYSTDSKCALYREKD